MSKQLLRAATFSLLAATPAVALAGGFETADNGTRSLGRAGAYAAGVDEPSALYYNPAALTRLDGFDFTLNLNLVDYNASFQRADFVYQAASAGLSDPERRITFDKVEQETAIFPAPMFFASHNFGLENTTFGIGAYGPSAFGAPSYPMMSRRPADFEGDGCGVYLPCRDDRTTDANEAVANRDGGQAYMMVDQSVLVVYPSLAVAHFFERANLSLGLTAQLVLMTVDFTVGVDGDGSQASDGAFTSTEADDLFTPNTINVNGISGTGILGLLWEPNNRIAIGASYRPQFRVVATGEIDLDFPAGLSGAGLSLSDDSTKLRVNFPDVVRLGAVYTHRDANEKEIFDLELNVVWENWSVMKYYEVDVAGVVNDEAGTLDGRNIPRLRLNRQYQDSWSIRLGSDIRALLDEEGHGPVFRLGANFETPTSPEEWTNIDFTPFLRVGGSIGFSYHVGRTSIDLGYQYVWSPSRTVENGEYDLLAPLWVCEDPAGPDYDAAGCAGTTHNPSHAVNNGRYETWTQVISIGTTYGW